MLGWVFAHPVVCAVLLFGLWWTADRMWIRVWSPERWLLGRREVVRLRRLLAHNPHDRDARHKLATQLVERGGHREALALLERNIADGEQDTETFVLAGIAAFGTGACERASELLERARAQGSRLTVLGVDVELARGWMRHRRFADALPPLLRFADARPGSVEAHARLAQVHARLGDAQAAARRRAEAWNCWREQPPFQRRIDRPWAWRLRPQLAALHVGVAAVAVVCLAWLLSRIEPSGVPDEESRDEPRFDRELRVERAEQGWHPPRIEPPPTTARFELRPLESIAAQPPQLVAERADLDRNGRVDLRSKAASADFCCRLPESYGPARPLPGDVIDGWRFHDVETGAYVNALVDLTGVIYVAYARDEATAERSVFAFEQLVEAQPLRDCKLALRSVPGIVLGVANGKPFAHQRADAP